MDLHSSPLLISIYCICAKWLHLDYFYLGLLFEESLGFHPCMWSFASMFNFGCILNFLYCDEAENSDYCLVWSFCWSGCVLLPYLKEFTVEQVSNLWQHDCICHQMQRKLIINKHLWFVLQGACPSIRTRVPYSRAELAQVAGAEQNCRVSHRCKNISSSCVCSHHNILHCDDKL